MTRAFGIEALGVLLLLSACACGAGSPASATEPRSDTDTDSDSDEIYQRGKATWYGGRFHGRKTASGEKFDKGALTAAHKKLPFGTKVRVENQANGRSVVVRINDRGPYGKGRVIDVSEAAAQKLGMIKRGVAPVTIAIVSRPPGR